MLPERGQSLQVPLPFQPNQLMPVELHRRVSLLRHALQAVLLVDGWQNRKSRILIIVQRIRADLDILEERLNS